MHAASITSAPDEPATTDPGTSATPVEKENVDDVLLPVEKAVPASPTRALAENREHLREVEALLAVERERADRLAWEVVDLRARRAHDRACAAAREAAAKGAAAAEGKVIGPEGMRERHGTPPASPPRRPRSSPPPMPYSPGLRLATFREFEQNLLVRTRLRL
jgi:septal ring factor EnvC (AmiA/AmiB activator)